MSLKRLRKEVFGPYKDVDMLSPTFYKSNNYACLTDVRLFKRDNSGNYQNTGLTKTELLNSAVDNIYFTGVLKVSNLGWLAPEGQNQLRRDIRTCAARLRMRSIPTLESIAVPATAIPTEAFIQVLICCKKAQTATFLTNESHRNSLIFLSTYTSSERKIETHNFEIVSLHVQTYRLSRRYLERYKLVSIVSDTANGAIPLGERNIDWLIERVLEVHSKENNDRRIIFDVEDSDFEQEGKLKTHRRPRFVSRREVRALLAKDAPWLIAQQLARRSHVRDLNLTSLFDFCLKNTKRLGRNGRRVLVLRPDVVETCRKYQVVEDRADFEAKMEVAKKTELASIRPATPPPAAAPLDDPDNANGARGRRQQNRRQRARRVVGGELESDSDATVYTSSEATGSDADIEVPEYNLRKDVFHLVLPPRGHLKWECRRPRCGYTVDLLEMANSLRLRKVWVAGNDKFRKEWEDRVRQHVLEEHDGLEIYI